TNIFAHTVEVGTEIVKAFRLSEFFDLDQIKRPALLKIDVQGGEYDVLLGSEELLPAFDWIYVECSEIELYEGQALRKDVQAWLEKRGYDVEAIGPTTIHRGELVQMDMLFARASADSAAYAPAHE
ncbi:MAG: FkbM family methyltransferase, partial [Geminicoccaceae bacterium]